MNKTGGRTVNKTRVVSIGIGLIAFCFSFGAVGMAGKPLRGPFSALIPASKVIVVGQVMS